jgi:hypothetical protein
MGGAVCVAPSFHKQCCLDTLQFRVDAGQRSSHSVGECEFHHLRKIEFMFRLPLCSKAFVVSVAGALLLTCNLAAQTFTTAPSNPVIRSQNTVTADPPVPRPQTTPCTVSLFSNVTFADFSGKPFTYDHPTACPGPWAKIVFEADFSINAGRQFDRTANIWIGGTNVYFGTTAEPSRTVARNWHVESDLTDYAALFAAPHSGEADLGNLVNSTFTSVLVGSADLQFYPMAKHDNGSRDDEARQTPGAADMVLPLSNGLNGGTVNISGSQQLERTFNFPSNVERAFLDVYAQSQASDEFWYACVPNALAHELQSCPGTAFRESEITIDGQPAGVAPVYPWIYTGGIDPGLWRPIVGVQTLNFTPYRVNLTPFAGVLSDGQPHTVALSVFNAQDHFSTTASLLLYLDHRSSHVSGTVVQNTLAASPVETVQQHLATAADGTETGTVTTTSSRFFTISGDANTSHGKVHTEVAQKIAFSNAQQFSSNLNSGNLVQNITQNTTISALTDTAGRGEQVEDFTHFEWPLIADINFVVNPDGTAAQTTTIQQAYKKSAVVTEHGHPEFFSVISDQVAPTSTLLFTASGTSLTGQSSSQNYFSFDSTGACYSRGIVATAGALTSVTNGKGCDQDRNDENGNEK